MPVYLRIFYFKRLQKQYKDEAEEIKKHTNKSKTISPLPRKK